MKITMSYSLIVCIILLLDLIALDLISRRKNGMERLLDSYSEWYNIDFIGLQILAVFYMIIVLPITIPMSIYTIITQYYADRKNRNSK